MSREWRIEDSIYRRAVEVVVWEKHPHDILVGQPTDIMFLQHEDGTIIERPTLTLKPDDAQQIINELWRIGYRPKDGSGAVAHTEAMKAHLDDMRKIAFNRLKILS